MVGNKVEICGWTPKLTVLTNERMRELLEQIRTETQRRAKNSYRATAPGAP